MFHLRQLNRKHLHSIQSDMESLKEKNNLKTLRINMEILDLKQLWASKTLITLEDKNYNGHHSKIIREILLILTAINLHRLTILDKNN